MINFIDKIIVIVYEKKIHAFLFTYLFHLQTTVAGHQTGTFETFPLARVEKTRKKQPPVHKAQLD